MSVGFELDRRSAAALDAADPLAEFRDRFATIGDRIYMDGNSLGLPANDSLVEVERVLDEWRTLAIEGWFGGEKPWLYMGEHLGEICAPLVGAEPRSLVATGTTTVNLHALVSTLYAPKARRSQVLTDDLTFPSDIYALRSQVALRGFDPEEHLVFVPSADGRTLDEDHIIERMTDRVALILLPSVLYRSGQLLDIERLTSAAHDRGIVIGFDCSHSVGVVPHQFDQWGVDFAFWCGYKYLNGGPGCSAFLYLNKKHFERGPGLAGWYGYKKEKQFDLRTTFEHEPGAGGWQISTPSVLSAAPLEASIGIVREAGIGAIREKSLNMTSYLMFLIDEILSQEYEGFSIATPRAPERRGGHVALTHKTHSIGIYEALMRRRVVADSRPPDVIRIAPSPLYNTYNDVWQVVQNIKAVMDAGEYRASAGGT